MENDRSSEINLRDLLRVVFRYKLIIIIVLIIVMVPVYIATELRTPSYGSSVRILVTTKMQKDVEVQRDLGPGDLMLTQMQLLYSMPIIERVVRALRLHERPIDYEKKYATRIKAVLIDRNTRKLKLDLERMTPDQREVFLFNRAVGNLSGKIRAGSIEDTSMFDISVIDLNPVGSAKIANAVSRSFVIFDLEQQIAELQLTYGKKNVTIKKLEKYIENLQRTLDGSPLPDIEAYGPASIKIVSQAGRGTPLPIRPSKSGALFAAFLVSIVTGVVLAFGFDYFDHTFKSSRDVETFLNIPFLGSVPKQNRKNKLIKMNSNPSSKYLRSLQNLSNQIYLLIKTNNLKTILLTGIEGSKENAVTIANIGIYLSHNTGHKVLIIDANFRNPSLRKIFNIPNSRGLIDVLDEKIKLDETIIDMGSHLYFLPTGEMMSNGLANLNSSMMSDVIKKVKEQYDIVFVVCADIKNIADAVILSSITDGLIVAINAEKDRRQIVKNAIVPFEKKNVNILGAILNNCKYVIPKIIYKFT